MNIKSEEFKNKRRRFFCAFIILLFFLFVYSTEEVSKGSLVGLQLCYEVIVPSLFPFFVLGNLFIAWGGADFLSMILKGPLTFLFKNSACAAPFVLGILCGYPLGAKSVCSLYERGGCTKAEAEYMLSFCNNTGPAFAIGATGIGLLHSMRAGVILYVCQVFAAVVTGVILSHVYSAKGRRKPSITEKYKDISPVSDFIGAISDGLYSILGVCAFVVFFSALLNLFHSLYILKALSEMFSRLLPFFTADQIQAVLYGFFEITNGVSQSARHGGSLSFALCALILSWGGLSMHFQAMLFTKEHSLSLKPYFIGKSLNAVIDFALVAFLSRLSPAAVGAFLPLDGFTYFNSSYFYFCALIAILIGLVFIGACLITPRH